MFVMTILCLVVVLFLSAIGYWAYGQVFMADPAPESRSYDGIVGTNPPPVNDLKYDDIPLQSPISTDPRRELFESLLKADEAAANLGHDDAARAELIDNRFGNLLFRKKKAE